MKPRSVVLASSSPRRAFFLNALGIPFTSDPPDIDESRLSEESPRRYVRRLAVEKAQAVAERNPEAWVVAEIRPSFSMARSSASRATRATRAGCFDSSRVGATAW